MKDFQAYIGRLTPDETKELMAECISNMTDNAIIEVLNSKLDEDVKEELAAQWSEE